MRLWHKDLIPLLPRQQLLGQWRECCLIAKQIAEKGTPNHVLVNKIMLYPEESFNRYAAEIYIEMKKRIYEPDWDRFMEWRSLPMDADKHEDMFSGWHNDRYLKQCLANLQEKHDCGAIPDDEWEKIADKYPEWR